MTATLGVLVAGGRGERLNRGIPKALVEVGGRRLLDRALETLRAVCDTVVIAAPADMELPLPPSMRGPKRAPDPPNVRGPLGGLVAGLGAHPFARAIALGVDFPFVTSVVLERLLARLEGDEAAVIPAPGGKPQPLAAAYAPRATLALAMVMSRGERALVPAVLTLDPLILPDSELANWEGGSEAFFNLNTPEDFAEAERRFASAAREHRA